MTTAAVDPATCTQCGATAPLRMMLMNEMGALTCNACLTKKLDQEGSRKRAKNTMLAPAMVSALAYLTFIVPVVNFAAPGVLAAIAMWGAIGGLRLHHEFAHRKDDHGVSSGLLSGLFVVSILTIVFATYPLAIQIISWIGLALG